MPQYRVKVIEHVRTAHLEVTIEAESKEAAVKMAEEMRANGDLRVSQETVDAVDIFAYLPVT